MPQLDTLDLIVLVALLCGTVAYFTKGVYWAVPKDPYAAFGGANGAAKAGGGSRNVVEKMKEQGKNCVIFYGSQTGTAEDYASRLAKEGALRYGLKTMTVDLEEYDYDTFDTFPEDAIAFFVMATYGEGEPTDNAVDFYEHIGTDEPTWSKQHEEDAPLSKMKFVAFGLGNNTYEHYNEMVRKTVEYLEKFGARRISEVGEGDDGAGTMEEDFLAWKDPMWADLALEMGLEEREAVYEPSYDIIEKEDLSVESETVYLGEPNKNHLEGKSKGPYNANNPYIAPIKTSTELYEDKTRDCLHQEIDVSGTNLNFTTGDHVAIWPTNAGREVDRFLNIVGLNDKRDTVVVIKALDATAKIPFPSPTTYDTIARYQLEINAPVSRQFVSSLAPFAPSDSIKDEMTKIGGDKEYFKKQVSSKNYNIATFLETMSKGDKWTKVPFSLFIEGLNKLQPRYYSISSSSHVNKQLISITAVVESVEKKDAQIVKGVTTNYLLSLHLKKHGEANPDPHGLSYALDGPRNKYDGVHVPVHIRHSNFKLPSDPSIPIIMVGPGTGVAPFRGFVQERAALAREGQKVGKTLLFFGCRRSDQDYMYKDEWQEFKKDLGDSFEIVTAFSREGPEKVYVQHRMKERSKEINEILQNKGYFYVCGDAASMAREVNELVGKIMQKERGLPEGKGEELVKQLRSSNRYQEDVWS